MSHHDFVVVVGCGRLGALIANRLSGDGSSVVVVDVSEEAFSALAPDFSGFKVTGDAAELGVLRRAHVEKAEVLMAVTGDDNVNLFVSQAALKTFGVSRPIARVGDVRRQEFYTHHGIEAFSPTAIVGEQLLTRIGEGSPS